MPRIVTKQRESAQRTTFFENSPVLTRADVLRTHGAWRRGEAVLSGLVAVGHVAWTEKEEEFFTTMTDVSAERYSSLGHTPWQRSLLNDTMSLRDAYRSLLDQELSRTDLDGVQISRMFGGYYRAGISGEPWHSDDHAEPSVRYTIAHGVGSTEGMVGRFFRADIVTDGVDRGDLLPEAPIPERLNPVTFPVGTLLRFMVDAHRSPPGDGLRIVQQTTILLQ